MGMSASERREVLRKARRRGKDNERKTAKLLNMKRRGILGGEDLTDDKYFSVESKSRNKLPVFLKKSYLQAEVNCKKSGNGRIVVLQLHEKGDKRLNDLVILKMKDFIKLKEAWEKVMEGRINEETF